MRKTLKTLVKAIMYNLYGFQETNLCLKTFDTFIKRYDYNYPAKRLYILKVETELKHTIIYAEHLLLSCGKFHSLTSEDSFY